MKLLPRQELVINRIEYTMTDFKDQVNFIKWVQRTFCGDFKEIRACYRSLDVSCQIRVVYDSGSSNDMHYGRWNSIPTDIYDKIIKLNFGINGNTIKEYYKV